MIMIAIVALMVSCEPLHVDDLPHSIIYTLDGGYWTEEAPITSAVFNNRVILPVCEKRGYTLTGWKSEQVKVEGSTETEFSFIMPAEDVNVTPIWSANINPISYDLSGAAWPSLYEPAIKARTNDTVIISKDPELTGSEFVRWQSNDADISLTKDGWSFVMPTEKVSLKAVFSDKAFMISYILGEGAVWDGSYFVDFAGYGQNIEIIAEPVRKGYTFIGWISEDVELSHNKIWSFTMPGKDVSIEADWSSNRNSITYMGTEGSDFDQSKYPTSALSGDVITLPNLTKEERNFRGWKITGAEVFLAEDGKIQFKMSGEDVIAKALWKGNEYSITYNNVGESVSGQDKLPLKGFAGDIIDLPRLTYDNHVLTEWTSNPQIIFNLGAIEGTYTFEMPKSDVVLTANWEVKINYEGIDNAAADGFLPESIKNGSTIYLPSLSKYGYKFDGWYIGDKPLTKEDKGYELTQSSDAPQTITAKWKNVYKVVYYCYGQRMTTDPVVEGETYKVRENLKPALENFAGWVDNNDEYKLYTSNEVITEVNKNITLNAVYATPINGRIFYDDFDPNINKNQYLFFDKDFKKIDYHFTLDYGYSCYVDLADAVYYWTSSRDRNKDRFYAYDTVKHDDYLYWVPDHFDVRELKRSFDTRLGVNSTEGSVMGAGKYNTEYLFGIIEKDKPIFYSDYLIGNSTYATKLIDSDRQSIWYYVCGKNMDMNYSTDWYVGSYGDYKKLIDVLSKKDSDEYNRILSRDVISSSEAGKVGGEDPFVAEYTYYWMWNGDGKTSQGVYETPEWEKVYKNIGGQVIPLRSF